MRELLLQVAAAMVVMALELAHRRRARRSRAAALARGSAVVLPAARRRPGRGPGGRWRHGSIVAAPGQLHWRPRRPRFGRRLELANVALTGRRAQRRSEWWWLSFQSEILRLDGATGPMELAVAPEEREAVERLLASASST